MNDQKKKRKERKKLKEEEGEEDEKDCNKTTMFISIDSINMNINIKKRYGYREC